MCNRMMRMNEVLQVTGLGRGTIFALIARGVFPKGQKIIPGGRLVGWRQSVIEEYLDNPDAWLEKNSVKEEMA